MKASDAADVRYRRAPHAGHYGHGGGHDLEIWDVPAPAPGTPANQWPAGVPRDAEYRGGSRDPVTGELRRDYVRIAPLSPGRCPQCTDVPPDGGRPVFFTAPGDTEVRMGAVVDKIRKALDGRGVKIFKLAGGISPAAAPDLVGRRAGECRRCGARNVVATFKRQTGSVPSLAEICGSCGARQGVR